MYIRRLRNAILCLCMYIRTACTIQSLAHVCMSVTLCTIEWPKWAHGDNYGPGLLPGLCGLYPMEEHDHKRFKSLPHSLRIAYDFSDALKIHLNVWRVCCPLNDQIRYQGCLEAVCQMAARDKVALILTAILHAE